MNKYKTLPKEILIEQPLNLEPSANVNAWACKIAYLTREAFAVLEETVELLPEPEGVLETESSVLADLKQEGRVWLARLSSQEVVGIVRAIPNGQKKWEMKRLGVMQRFRGLGIARRIVEHVEQEALNVGIERIIVRCVVERRLPPFYTNLGYRTMQRWAYPGKPLTMIAMERQINEPRQVFSSLWESEAALPSSGTYILWLWLPTELRIQVPVTKSLHSVPAGLYAYVGSVPAELATQLTQLLDRWTGSPYGQQTKIVGLDVRSGSITSHEICLTKLLTAFSPKQDESMRLLQLSISTGCQCPGDLVYLGSFPESVNPFIMPRSLEPKLLAVFRLPTESIPFRGNKE